MIFISDLADVIFFKVIGNKYSVICKDSILQEYFFLYSWSVIERMWVSVFSICGLRNCNSTLCVRAWTEEMLQCSKMSTVIDNILRPKIGDGLIKMQVTIKYFLMSGPFWSKMPCHWCHWENEGLLRGLPLCSPLCQNRRNERWIRCD